MLKEWSDDYLIGIDEIDEQHQGFFAAAHRLYDGIMTGDGEKVVEEAVEFLRSYAKKHFQTEEAFMQKYEYPRLGDHKRLHAQFHESLEGLLYDFNTFGPSQHLADHALEIAQDWLIDHIADEDVLYARHVKKRLQ